MGGDFRSFLLKKSKAIMIPFAFFYVLGMLPVLILYSGGFLKYVIGGIKLFTLIPIESGNVNLLGVGAIWFLPSLFEVYLIHYAVNKVTRSRYFAIFIGLISVALSTVLLTKYGMGSLFYLIQSLQFVLYFVVADKFKDIFLNDSPAYKWILIAIALFALRYIPIDRTTTFEMLLGGLQDKFSFFGIIILLLIVSKVISELPPPTRLLVNILCFFGSNSLTVLGTHLIAMSIVKRILQLFMKEGPQYYVILFAVVVMSCTICIFIFNKYLPRLVNKK